MIGIVLISCYKDERLLVEWTNNGLLVQHLYVNQVGKKGYIFMK